jgi:ferredoxin-NADP reductase
MAAPHFATLTGIETFAEGSRALTFRTNAPLGFRGGQFVIVDTGLVSDSGKAVKRAYSLLGSDAEQSEIVVASKRIHAGAGSAYLHGLRLGDTIKFSGAWGKLAPRREGRTLVLATDTGITAALGLVRGQGFAPLRPTTRLLWLRTSPSYFLPDEWLREQLPAGITCELALVPPAGHPERLAHVRSIVGDDLLPGRVASVFITGDGAVNYALLDHYRALGLPVGPDDVESFFNYPKKSPAAATTVAA